MTGPRTYPGLDFYDAVRGERAFQDAKWGPVEQFHSRIPSDWLAILTEEVGEVAECVVFLRFPVGPADTDTDHLRSELIQVAAVVAAWIAVL